MWSARCTAGGLLTRCTLRSCTFACALLVLWQYFNLNVSMHAAFLTGSQSSESSPRAEANWFGQSNQSLQEETGFAPTAGSCSILQCRLARCTAGGLGALHAL